MRLARSSLTGEIPLRPVVMKGRQMSVHKPLVSASQACEKGNLDIWVDKDGGVLIPSDGPVAKGLHREYARLIKKHTSKNVMDVYMEKGGGTTLA